MDPLSLIESNEDILSPDTDPDVVKSFVQTLRSHQCFRHEDANELQPLISKINESCLKSYKNSNNNGLAVLDVLVAQCSPEIFTHYGYPWTQLLVSKILIPKRRSPAEKMIALRILSRILRLAPRFSEVSRLISGYTSTILTALLKDDDDNENYFDIDVIQCLTQLLQSFPGSCGNQGLKIEKMLLSRFGRVTSTNRKLAECFALLPRLGGSGRDGIHHKESWTKYFKRLFKTYIQIQESILDLQEDRVRNAVDYDMDDVTTLEFPSLTGSKNRQIADVFRKCAKLRILREIIVQFLKSPFPYSKTFSPAMLYTITDALLPFRLRPQGVSHESSILFAVLPELFVNAAVLAKTWLSACGRDLFLFLGHNLQFIHHVLDQTRCGTGFPYLRTETLKLLKKYVETFRNASGFHLIGSEIVSNIISDCVPTFEDNDSVVVLDDQRKSNKRAKNKKKNNGYLMSSLTGKSDMSAKGDHDDVLIRQSLLTLTSIFDNAGTTLKPSIHKDVQCVVLRLCFTTQERATSLPSSECRLAMYRLLVSLTLNFHPKFPSPLRYSIMILSNAIRDSNPDVARFCRSGLSVCESAIHPLSPTLHVDTPLTETEMKTIMNEIMKVHIEFDEESVTSLTMERIGESVMEVEKNQDEKEKKTEPVTNSISVDKESVKNGALVEDSLKNTTSIEKTGGNPREDDLRVKETERNKKDSIVEPVEVEKMEVILRESRKRVSDDELMKTFYKQDRPSVVIPEVPNDSPVLKKKKEDVETTVPSDTNEDKDLNLMLSDFVSKGSQKDLSSLKRKFKESYEN